MRKEGIRTLLLLRPCPKDEDAKASGHVIAQRALGDYCTRTSRVLEGTPPGLRSDAESVGGYAASDAAGFVGGGEGGRAAGSRRTVYPDRRRSLDDAKASTLCTNGPGHQRLGRNSSLVVVLRFGSLRFNAHTF